ncbi:MAG: hypothetical protein V4451_04805 [Pseudomonadota bacterium]
MTDLVARGLRPVSELGAHRPHGDRLRYLAGCKCFDCRRANSAYETARAAARKAGDWNGFVPAEKARLHLAALSAVNVGRRAVGHVADVGDTVLMDIISGRKKQIRARTERKILAVTAAAASDGALIPAKPSWKLLNELIHDGWPKAELARQLGYKAPALQFRKTQITVRNAYDVEQLHAKLRSCSARGTLKLLDDLQAEGFRMAHIQERVEKLAHETGADKPDLTVRKGRIRADAAALVQRVYDLMTE